MFKHQIKVKWISLICIAMCMTLNAKSIVDQTGDEKFNTLKNMIEKRINNATLITSSGKIKSVTQFCMPFGKMATYLDYDGQGKEVNTPQYMKDYAQNAITQCRGKLYTTALINHLEKTEKNTCTDLNYVLDWERQIKKNLAKSDDMKLWETFQTVYKKICQKGI